MKKCCFFILILVPSILAGQDTKENSDFKLAVSLYNDKLYDLAYEQFQRFIKQYPTTQQGIEAQFYLGLTQMKLKKYDEAKNTFQNFALFYTEHPKAPEAWLNVAECYYNSGRLQEAALAYERVKTFHPHSKHAPVALYRASELYQTLSDTENYRRTLTTLTREYTTPETLPARLKLAELLIHDKYFNEAIQECRTVFSATNEQSLKAQALLTLSKAFSALGNLPETYSALSEITTKYTLTDAYNEALVELGTFHESYGNVDGARTQWKKILEIPQVPQLLKQRAALELAYSHIRTQDYRNALIYFSKAAEIPGKWRQQALFFNGLVAELIGDTITAIQCYSRLYNDTTTSTTMNIALVAGYKFARFTKQYSEALRILQLLQTHYPSDHLTIQLSLEGAQLALNELRTPYTTIDFCDWILRTKPHSFLADEALYTLGLAQQMLRHYDAALATFDKILIEYPASELSERAAYQKWYIETFEYEKKTSGIEKLAALVGDVITQRPQGELAFRLGEIYFDDLKDYLRAAHQFTHTLSLSLPDTLKQRTLFMVARSYELQALKEGVTSKKGLQYIQKAILFYDSLLYSYPSSPYAPQARIASFTYKVEQAKSTPELVNIARSLDQLSSTDGIDDILLRIGTAYVKNQNFENAMSTFKLICQQYPLSPHYPTALYQLGVTLLSLGKKDSAALIFAKYVEQFPNHPYSAKTLRSLIQYYLDGMKLENARNAITKLRERYSYTTSLFELQLLDAQTNIRAREFSRALRLYTMIRDTILTSPYTLLRYRTELLESLYGIAVCYDSLKKTIEAHRAYSQYVTYDTHSDRTARIFLTLSVLARNSRDVERATFYLKQSASISSKSTGQQSNIAYETAQLLFNAGKYDEALTNYLEAQKQNTNDSLRTIIDGAIVCSLFRLDKLDEANKRAGEFQKNYPKQEQFFAQFEFERGSYFMRKEKYPVAFQYFENVTKKYSKTSVVPEALYWKARIYEADGKLQQAVALYDSIVQLYPKSSIVPKTRLSLGNAYYAMEQWEQAAQHYRTILNTEDQFSDLIPLAMSNLILTYKQMEMYDAALELTRKYIETYPTDPGIIDKKIDIGLLYQKLGYYQQAIFHFQSLIVPGNNDLEAELRYYIGECYYLKGEYQQAVLEFLKVPYLVSKIGKVDWIATSYYMAGQSYEKLGNPEKAIQMYKQIVDRKESDSQFKIAAQKEIERVKTIMGIK
ncbi:MAG: tetratricopeptide repeat protein [Bacteroidetes bacterium]|nr:tetratricopeptide repeat protein [Bacteroidota bacterium]